uniref:coenzyme Q-binding protein COQ10 homolog B, mitochondrial-like n=1 Tax=Styela clava TaxID=7725 RepID=UPI00193949C5|nr:coenzyme Q-binding protein COQ10 homolog B, mitochondrial-like [Styela clava]
MQCLRRTIQIGWNTNVNVTRITQSILHVEPTKLCVVCVNQRLLNSSSLQSKNFTSKFTKGFMSRKLEYSERKTLRYPLELMYCIVEDVDRYSEFVPWCKKSNVISTKGPVKRAKLEVGFGKITEKYNSTVTCAKPHLVKAICTDGLLFNSLLCIWHFTPGRTKNSCVIDFQVSFEFRSLLYSQLANMVFNEIVRTMVKAFEKRAYEIQALNKKENDDILKQTLP